MRASGSGGPRPRYGADDPGGEHHPRAREAYIADQLATRSPATARRRYRGVRQFFKWLLEEGDITKSPMENHEAAGPAQEAVPVVEVDKLKKLLADCEATFEGRRDEAILRVFIDTGARLGEVAGLQIAGEDGEDVDLDGGVLQWSAKGRRQRLLPIGPRTVKALDRYLRKRTQHDAATTPHLWLGKKQGHLRRQRRLDRALGRDRRNGVRSVEDPGSRCCRWVRLDAPDHRTWQRGDSLRPVVCGLDDHEVIERQHSLEHVRRRDA
jgi:site-specific recombinase XerC